MGAVLAKWGIVGTLTSVIVASALYAPAAQAPEVYATPVVEDIIIPEPDPTDFYSQLTDAVVRVEVGMGGERMWLGSGWGLKHDASGTFVVTNKHVAPSDIYDYTIILGSNRLAKATFVGAHDDMDLAVLHVKGEPLALLAIAEMPPKVGDVVFAVGSPFGYEDSVTRGIVSYVHRVVEGEAGLWIQTDTPINPGNSGGVLVNELGMVVGIPSLGYGQWDSGVNFCLASASIVEGLDAIFAGA